MKRKTGILGGTFDPPHIGHLLIANEVLHALQLDEIRFMPNRIPPHKQKKSDTAPEQRLDMLELAIAGEDKFSVEPIELGREGPSYTYDTMESLKSPDTEYYFIIGGDMVEYLPNWHRIEELVRLVKFVGVNRPSYSASSPYPILHVPVPAMDISSSDIRQRIAAGRTIKYLLPDSVIHYIKEHQLYES